MPLVALQLLYFLKIVKVIPCPMHMYFRMAEISIEGVAHVLFDVGFKYTVYINIP